MGQENHLIDIDCIWWSLPEKVFEIQKKIWSDFDKQLGQHVTNNLKELGYEFISESEFILFVQKRVSRICFNGKPNYFEIYLDFIDSDNKGTLICCYSDKVDFIIEGNSVKVTIGGSVS